MRRPALIFDFGNVVAHFDYRKACEHYGRRVGMSGEEFLQRIRSLGFSPLVQRYESGEITSQDFSRSVLALAGLEMSHEEFATAWSDIFSLNEPVASLIADLKSRGYTLILGSNTNNLHAAQFRRQFAETLAHFDRLVLSFEIGHVKPTAPFYIACAEASGAPPGQCVFIDDIAENVEGARAAGLLAIQFLDVPSLATELQSLGIEVV